MGKLVRDNIPNMIRADGRACEVRVLSEKEFDVHLREKLIEESQEVSCALSAELLGELADVLQVMLELAEIHDLSLPQIEQARSQKLISHGGFSQRILLVD